MSVTAFSSHATSQMGKLKCREGGACSRCHRKSRAESEIGPRCLGPLHGKMPRQPTNSIVQGQTLKNVSYCVSEKGESGNLHCLSKVILWLCYSSIWKSHTLQVFGAMLLSPFYGRGTEAQRDQVPCLRLPMEPVAQQGLNPGLQPEPDPMD